jgi:glycerol kinase
VNDPCSVLALDQGTTSSRAIVFDRDGQIRGFEQAEYPQLFPQPGWVEHDPDDIWRSQLETARGALRNAGIEARDIAAIGITNQRESAVLWDRATGRPVCNAIVWQDRRTAAVCDELRARGLEDEVRRLTGLLLDPYFSATKIAWMLDRVPGLRERAERGDIAFGTVDSWLIWNLTGGGPHVTDVTNASRTLLFDIERLEWSDRLLEIFRVPRALLPRVLPSTADFGTARAEWLGAPIRIAGVAGDQQAALIGQAGFTRGLAKNTYGTGSFVVLNTGDGVVRSNEGLLSTIAFGFEPGKVTYALEGSIFATGAAVQWLRDGLGLIERSSDSENLARDVPDCGGVYFVPAFAGLGAPYWDPYARGTLVGITRGTTRGHIARAALEAMGYQSAEVIAAMQRDAKLALSELRVDGGAARNAIAMQFQADILGVDVVRPQVTETTALGAAYLAGLQTGFWPDLEAVAHHWHEDRRFRPALEPQRRTTLLAGWTRAVERSRSWAVEDAPSDATVAPAPPSNGAPERSAATA